jgi:hypothetical protein
MMTTIKRHWLAALALVVLNLVVFAHLVFLTSEGVPHATIPFDFASQYSVWLVYISDSFRAGHFPLWSPYVGGGTPFFINPQSQLYSPLTLLVASTVGYTQRAAQLQSVFLLFLGGLGAYALACTLWRSRAAGLVAAVGYNFTSAIFANLEHTTIVSSAALAPWLFWAATLTAREGRAWAYPALAFLVYFLLTSGYPGVILMTLVYLSAYILYLIHTRPAPAREKLWVVLRHALTGLLGVGLAGAHWIPIVAHRKEFTRGAAPLSLEAALLGGNLFFRHLWGTVFLFMTEHPLPGTEPDISMRGVYFGALALPLAVAAVLYLKDEAVPAFAVLAVAAFLMACGGIFFGRLFLHILLPALNMSRFPSADSRSMMALGMVVLAGGGAALLRAGHEEARRFVFRASAALLAVLLAGMAAFRPLYAPEVYNNVVLNFVTAEVLFVAAALAALRVARGRALLVCLLSLLALEAGTCVLANPKIVADYVRSADEYRARRALDSRAFTAEAAGVPRLAIGGADMVSEESNRGYLEKRFYLSEYNPLRLSRFQRLLDGGFAEWMITGPRVVALPPDAWPGDYESFRQLARPVEYTILEYTPNQVVYRVRADADTVLVFNEIYFPGWRGSVDGARAPLFELAGLRALRVAAGEHAVTTTFRPRSFYLGLVVSLVSLLLFLAWLILPAVRRRRRRAEERAAREPAVGAA